MELPAGGEVAGVRAALDEVTVHAGVRRHGGEPRRQPHPLFMTREHSALLCFAGAGGRVSQFDLRPLDLNPRVI